MPSRSCSQQPCLTAISSDWARRLSAELKYINHVRGLKLAAESLQACSAQRAASSGLRRRKTCLANLLRKVRQAQASQSCQQPTCGRCCHLHCMLCRNATCTKHAVRNATCTKRWTCPCVYCDQSIQAKAGSAERTN